jgi:hypothetical protein
VIFFIKEGLGSTLLSYEKPTNFPHGRSIVIDSYFTIATICIPCLVKQPFRWGEKLEQQHVSELEILRLY